MLWLKIATAAITLIIFHSLLLPPFEFPDEQAHFATVQYISREWRMPGGDDLDLSIELKETEKFLGTYRDNYGNNLYTYHPEYKPEYTSSFIGKYETDIKNLNTLHNRSTYIWKEAARYPFLYYLYSSIWYYAKYTENILTQIYSVRLGSAVLASLTIIVVYFIGIEIFSKRILAATLASLVALQPMITFVGAGINSDNLHNLLFTIFIFLCIRLINHGWINKIEWKIAGIIILDIMTKPQGYITFPILITAIIVRFWKDKKFKIHLINFSIITGTSMLAMLVKDMSQIYVLLQSGTLPFVPKSNMHTNTIDLWQFIKYSLNKLYAQNMVWYWGIYKWLGVVLPHSFWWIANRIILVSTFGIFIYLYRYIKNSTNNFIAISNLLFLILTSVIYFLAIFAYDWFFTRSLGYSIGVQARYYFPTISAHMTILLVGWLSLGMNEHLIEILRKLLLTFFVAIQIAGVITIAMSYYDLTSLQLFITQASQYKPAFAKGEWWYLWIGLYVLSLLYLAYLVLKPQKIFTKEKA